MANYITGKDTVISLDDVVLGCVQSLSFSTEVEMVDVTCAASNGFRQQVPGTESWSGDLNSVLREFNEAEQASNVSIMDVYTKLKNGSLVDVEYTFGGFRFSAKAYIQNVSIDSSGPSDAVTWSASLQGYTPLLLTETPVA
ncbi:hypothetical protein F1C16_05200 [Hymenobacter sp. NBH84]|uniref:hypothetical protein n=1 Tax=Hymenobacter sp. NBH84 TaxID=2596915 RepID=UPI0016279BFD|nr:hypothetical protein [Hymenobacter sp. NBH84]QNE38992.1 hypothetical protein F1C16_05200 [Hymenobacter sp. NBH84]